MFASCSLSLLQSVRHEVCIIWKVCHVWCWIKRIAGYRVIIGLLLQKGLSHLALAALRESQVIIGFLLLQAFPLLKDCWLCGKDNYYLTQKCRIENGTETQLLGLSWLCFLLCPLYNLKGHCLVMF